MTKNQEVPFWTFLLFCALFTWCNPALAENKPQIVPRTRIVAAKNAKIKTSGTTLQQLNPGEVVIITQKNKEWLWVPLLGGWIKENDVKKPEELVELLSKSIQEEPTAERYHLRGIAHQVLKKYDLAIADLDASLKIKSENAHIYVNRGNIWRLKHKYDKALKDLDRAIELEKTNANAFNIRGLIYYQTEQFQKAIDDFSEAIRIQPKMISALNSRGIAYRDQNQIDLALQDFNQAIKLNRFVSEVFSNRASIWETQKKYLSAIQDYKRAIELNPTSAVPNNDLAWLYATCADVTFRDLPAAVMHAEKACELTQNSDANMLDTLATAYYENGQSDKAIESLQKAILNAEKNQKKDLQEKLRKFQKK